MPCHHNRMSLWHFPTSRAHLGHTHRSGERSASWLANILRPLPGRHIAAPDARNPASHLLNVFVHMAGGTSPTPFAQSLLEPLFDKEAEASKPLNNLDEGVAGYTFNLAPLHKSLSLSPCDTPSKNEFVAIIYPFSTPHSPSTTAQINSLIRVSVGPLPTTKPRIVHSAVSPHEILALIRDVGIDLFDTHWNNVLPTLAWPSISISQLLPTGRLSRYCWPLKPSGLAALASHDSKPAKAHPSPFPSSWPTFHDRTYLPFPRLENAFAPQRSSRCTTP